MRSVDTRNLRIGDKIVKEDKSGRIYDVCVLKKEIPPISCLGRHFLTEDDTLVCYLPGTVLVFGKI